MIQAEIIAATGYQRLYEQECAKNAELEARVAALGRENHALRLRTTPMSNYAHEWFANLQCKAKAMAAELAAFKTGEKYIEMKAASKLQLAEKDGIIADLKNALARANAQLVTMREKWQQVYDDVRKEHAREVAAKDRRIKELWERLLVAQAQTDSEKDKNKELRTELYGAKTELDDERERNRKLKSQINRDHENSSTSSSLNPNRKKITSNREVSGKKPGGQVGHPHHPRKRQTPTSSIGIPPPEEYADSARYRPTGRIITKQLVEIQLKLFVTEYSTPELRDSLTWQRVHAGFPGGLTDDVTYGGSVKALAFLLNNYCNVSIGKVSEIISELTGGELNISTGMISGLCREFSLKTEAERSKAIADILLEPVMNVDFTTVRVNGKNMNALVCAAPGNVIYTAKEHKGHDGVKGTPIEDYQGIMVHDHDPTFYNYGSDHQECNDHALRYLTGSVQNEPALKWNLLMRDLIRETIHFRKHLDPEDKRNPDEIDPGRVKEFEARYDELLGLAEEEYAYEPPSKYNKDGYNLYLRLRKFKANHLLFLHDRRVPHTNSRSERLLRILKRKQHQVMAFRSFASLEYLCHCLGTIATLRSNGENLYQSVGGIFDRQTEKKPVAFG